MNHNFGEKKEEFSPKKGANIPVWQSPKYETSKNKAIEIIESKKYGLEDGDFWILMNESKGGKMVYTGLITSHNACLKINDALEEKFQPDCVSVDKQGYNGSLVYTYCCPAQGIYEVGEASSSNCKNAYPYAMAYKRLFDRVVLKLSKLAYSGVYSEAEADEFKNPLEERETVINNPSAQDIQNLIQEQYAKISNLAQDVSENLSNVPMITQEQYAQILQLSKEKGIMAAEIYKRYNVDSIWKLTSRQADSCIIGLQTTKARR